MAIPGSKPNYEVHAKVRIGEKRQSQKGTFYPAAVEFFRSDSPDFAELAGAKPRTLRIRFIHDGHDDAFSTGLEWWAKDKNKNSLLACYTKGQTNAEGFPVALRKDQMLDQDDRVLGEGVGTGRLPILCRARECPQFKKKNCKPMGRVVFILDGDPLSRVWELDTKAWSSIENLTGTLKLAQAQGSLLGRLFELSVSFQTKGADRFPVMTLKEISEIDPVTAKAVAGAERDIAREKVREARERGVVDDARSLLALYFDHARPGWREDADWLAKFKARVEEVGYDDALKKVMGE